MEEYLYSSNKAFLTSVSYLVCKRLTTAAFLLPLPVFFAGLASALAAALGAAFLAGAFYSFTSSVGATTFVSSNIFHSSFL